MTKSVDLTNFPLDIDTLLSVLNYLNVGVYITDKNRKIMLWNREAERITGYKAGEVVGKACHEDILNHKDKNGQRLCTTKFCPLYRSIKTGVSSRETALLYARTNDNNRIAVSVNVAPLRNDEGDIIGGIEIFQDETKSITDLEFAGQIQKSLLPTSLPKSDNVLFNVRYFPHDLVGGDFYDLHEPSPGCYGILVADVRGHGVSAALYTMWLQSLGKRLLEKADTPADFMMAINKELSTSLVHGTFITLFYGIFDTGKGELIYSNAGHTPPLYLKGNQKNSEYFQTKLTGPPLGIIEDQNYDNESLSLTAGDILLCYTDGITETFIADGELLGIDGLGSLFIKEASKTGDFLLDRIHQSVLNKNADISFNDDVLLLSMEVV